jgi:hypothetical protein
MNLETEVEVARLDGYIHGITELNGRIREHLGSAYLISRQDQRMNAAELLVAHFSSQTELVFSSITQFSKGLSDLEKELDNYLAVDVLDCEQFISSEVISDRKKYLAFRVMDMLDVIGRDLGDCISATKLIARYNEEYKSQSVFFGFLFEGALLVLQFLVRSPW